MNFLDMGPLTEEVPFGTSSLTVRGLSAEDLFDLIAKYPQLKGLIDKSEKPDPASIMKLAPSALAEVLARSLGGEKEDERALKFVRSLSVGHQLKVVKAVFRLTFPEGVGPFVAQLREMTAMVQVSDGTSGGVSPDVLLADEPRKPPGPRRRAA